MPAKSLVVKGRRPAGTAASDLTGKDIPMAATPHETEKTEETFVPEGLGPDGTPAVAARISRRGSG